MDKTDQKDDSEQYSYYSEDTLEEIPPKQPVKAQPKIIKNVQQFKQFQKEKAEEKKVERSENGKKTLKSDAKGASLKTPPKFSDGKAFFQDKQKLLQVAIIIICILVLAVVILVLVIYFIKKGKPTKKQKPQRGISMIEKENEELSEKIQEMQKQYQDELQSDLQDIDLEELTQENLEKLEEQKQNVEPSRHANEEPTDKSIISEPSKKKKTKKVEKHVSFKEPIEESLSDREPSQPPELQEPPQVQEPQQQQQLTPEQMAQMQAQQKIAQNLLHAKTQQEDIVAKLQNQVFQTNRISTEDENARKANNLESMMNNYIQKAAGQEIQNKQAEAALAYQQQYEQEHAAEILAAQQQQQQEEADFMATVQ